MPRSEQTSEWYSGIGAGTDEGRDNSQLERMRLLGMKPEDESKLSTLRDYIAKLALARQAYVSPLPLCG